MYVKFVFAEHWVGFKICQVLTNASYNTSFGVPQHLLDFDLEGAKFSWGLNYTIVFHSVFNNKVSLDFPCCIFTGPHYFHRPAGEKLVLFSFNQYGQCCDAGDHLSGCFALR